MSNFAVMPLIKYLYIYIKCVDKFWLSLYINLGKEIQMLIRSF